MLVRDLTKIPNMPIRERFVVMAEGMGHLAHSVAVLEADAVTLGESGRHQSAPVLRNFAEEEAAKILILLDIARAGWKDQTLSHHLFKNVYYDHLARGLYVEAYDGRPANLAEIRRYIDDLRRSHYLDGPMDVDWIFRNEILNRREERLYVDYVMDENNTGRWTGPQAMEDADAQVRLPARTTTAIRLVAAMHRIGLLGREGLEVTRTTWDRVSVDDTTHWREIRPYNVAIVQQLAEQGIVPVTDENSRAARLVCDRWIFPLNTLDLSLTTVEISALLRDREQRMTWQ